MCIHCKQFLSDFLDSGIRKELSFTKSIRMQSLRAVLPEVMDWFYRISLRIQKYEFEMAFQTASQIARRDRSIIEYEYVIYSATFNILKYRLSWLSSELDYIQTILLENGFVYKGKTMSVYEYISYNFPRVFLSLKSLHEEHEASKDSQEEVPDNLYT